ncbi:hypothetical protein BGX31_001992 [Mortierella sp. GBA43]|nr:hypothetical protein BGX31_001992 [Mortierella sp. GBA43]
MGAVGSRDSQERLERQPLLARYYSHTHGGAPHLLPTAPVTELAKETKYDIINALDTTLTREELGSLEVYLALLLPIVRKYREERRETASVYCFLLNRWQFLEDAENDLANARLNETRAHACEMVATKILKAFSIRQLIDVLTYDFSPIKRKDVRSRLYLPHFEGDPSKDPMSAIEVAISGKAKYFMSNAMVQEIIRDSDSDNLRQSGYKVHEAVKAPSPKIQKHFSDDNVFSFHDNLYHGYVCKRSSIDLGGSDIMALSFALDECIELKDSGPSFYFESVWNLFDVPIYLIFVGFIGLRIAALTGGSTELSHFAYDFLGCNSILLWPRLFAGLDHYRFFGTMLIVLRQMLIDAMLFLALSFIFYVGFLQAFYVSANAKEEFMFLFSVKVMEEVKSDTLYEFQPPFNILAGIVVWPCSLFYSPEVVGKISRILLRVFYFPELVCIYIFEAIVTKRKQQHLPVRPGPVKHQQSYDAVPYSSSTSGIPTLKGLGNGQGEARIHTTGDNIESSAIPSILEGDNESSSSPSPSASNGTGTDSFEGFPTAPMPSSSKQRLAPLNTTDLTPTRSHEVMSPSFESICRFRDASRASSTTGQRSRRDPNEDCQRCTMCSCRAPTSAPTSAPYGMKTARRLSNAPPLFAQFSSDATRPSTFQGSTLLESVYRMERGSSGHGGGVSVPSHLDYHRHHEQSHQHPPQHQLEDEAQMPTRLRETEYNDMRTRMDQIESKLDRLMDSIAALAAANHQNH